jgi:16S rRNA (guanine527-N7)-methyltransferase
VEQERGLREFLLRSTKELGISLTEQQAQQFLTHLSQLLTWNRTTNLTTIIDPYEIVSKHFIDSLTGLSAFPFPSQSLVIDAGSGAGFPGIPLKIVRPDLRLVLVEPSSKKSSFLRFIVGALQLEQVSIFTGGLQQYVQEPHSLADVMVVRALRFEEIVEPATVVMKANGRVLLYRTEKMVKSASSAFHVESNNEFCLPMHHGSRVVTALTKVPSS